MRPRGMPWRETGPFEERRRFVATCRDSDESFVAICERFGISRQKGYKWLTRFEEGGLEALVDRSRRRHSNSRAVPAAVVELIVELRKRRPRWGPRKLVAVLERDYVASPAQAASVPIPIHLRWRKWRAGDTGRPCARMVCGFELG